MKRLFTLLLLGAALTITASSVLAQVTVMVGGAPMYPTKDIVDNAVNSKDHTTLVAAVKAAGLVATLKGSGPFTVFAPTNDAFTRLPAGTVDTLLQPANQAALAKVLTYHVVVGKLSVQVIDRMITAGQGKAILTTVSGDSLTATKQGNAIVLVDAKGGRSYVTIADVNQSNGVIHVVDRVLLPS
jgi:uncharacterized surface protein with fasciclin (FAS1) repeats